MALISFYQPYTLNSGRKTPDFFEINNFRNFRQADYKVCFAGTIHDLVEEYTIMESKVHDFD